MDRNVLLNGLIALAVATLLVAAGGWAQNGEMNVPAGEPEAATTPADLPITTEALDADTIVQGFVCLDTNGDGACDLGLRDDGSPLLPMADVTVYADLNNNGRFEDGEPSDITDDDGFYSIIVPGAGTYIIRQVTPAGFDWTGPGEAPSSGGAGLGDTITVGAGEIGTTDYFTNEPPEVFVREENLQTGVPCFYKGCRYETTLTPVDLPCDDVGTFADFCDPCDDIGDFAEGCLPCDDIGPFDEACDPCDDIGDFGADCLPCDDVGTFGDDCDPCDDAGPTADFCDECDNIGDFGADCLPCDDIGDPAAFCDPCDEIGDFGADCLPCDDVGDPDDSCDPCDDFGSKAECPEVCDGIDNDGNGIVDDVGDADGDGVSDCLDACPGVDDTTVDATDVDQDGLSCDDPCPGLNNNAYPNCGSCSNAGHHLVPDVTEDCNSGGPGDECDIHNKPSDCDEDGIRNGDDPCPTNPDNTETGNADGDFWLDCEDPCPNDPTDQCADGPCGGPCPPASSTVPWFLLAIPFLRPPRAYPVAAQRHHGRPVASATS